MNKPGNEHELNNANNYVTNCQINKFAWKVVNDVPAIFFAKVGAAVMKNRKRLVNHPFLLDNNTMCYVFDNVNYDINFMKTLFDNIDLPSLIQVGALPSYNASDVENMFVCIPNSKSEQSKIGKTVHQIDNLITLHQRMYYNKIFVYRVSLGTT